MFGAFTSPQLGIATQVPIRSIEARSGISFGKLAAVDPLAGEEESLDRRRSRAAPRPRADPVRAVKQRPEFSDPPLAMAAGRVLPSVFGGPMSTLASPVTILRNWPPPSPIIGGTDRRTPSASRPSMEASKRY